MTLRWRPDPIEIGSRIMAHPETDVQALTAWVVAESQSREVHSPLAMLDAAIRSANERGTYRRAVESESVRRNTAAIEWGERGDAGVARDALAGIFAMLDRPEELTP